MNNHSGGGLPRTEILTIRGIVQGVGFRPTVWRIASRLSMRGLVRNMGGVVQIIVTDTEPRIEGFIAEIRAGKPRMARIDAVEREVIGETIFHDFQIAESTALEDEIAVVPPDIAVCDDCLREFRDPDDPRFGYGFISCTNCGPRYTIMERLPYDRETTTMADFELCPLCGGEYRNPATRRYHAQTVSCHDCGPQPLWRGTEGDGGVIALKGVGGYYLVCDATDAEAVAKLRRIKRREQKPFAVMFSSLEDVRGYCRVSAAEEGQLLSPRRPIVLLEHRPELDAGTKPLAAGVCGTSRFVGAFLPSFALQYTLLEAARAPLVMTSANLSDLPILTEDAQMFALMEKEPEIAGALWHKRRIAAGLDDSLVRVVDGDAQLLRRAKGYVPTPVFVPALRTRTKEDMVFAAGGHLKSCFALSKGAYVYLSRHLGDLGSLESEALYRETFDRMRAFNRVEPGGVVCDLHPAYDSTRIAEEYAAAHGLPLLRVQHHHAHIASVMAEHGLTGPVIGVSFDGTGYGPDGTVWGGEILLCEGTAYERFSHLRDTEMPGGDEAMREGWKAALAQLAADTSPKGDGSYGSVFGPDSRMLGDRIFEINLDEIISWFNTNGIAAQWNGLGAETVAQALRAGVNTVRSSSMGRLFDAASSLLGIRQISRYEGEAAIELENAAWRAMEAERRNAAPVCRDRLALEFHRNVARQILSECKAARKEKQTNKVCLSGGVFQNKILIEEALRLLRAEAFETYINVHVPPNDGGLALGQCYLGMQAFFIASR
ncbi:MAG: carbamoyltransferase HypF [Clostridiales bacterium]|nr:carbamoyltransferase HypF [Clostridiales bacterium]